MARNRYLAFGQTASTSMSQSKVLQSTRRRRFIIGVLLLLFFVFNMVLLRLGLPSSDPVLYGPAWLWWYIGGMQLVCGAFLIGHALLARSA